MHEKVRLRLDHKCMAWDGTGIDFPNFVIVLVNVLFVTKLHHFTVQRQQIRMVCGREKFLPAVEQQARAGSCCLTKFAFLFCHLCRSGCNLETRFC